MLLEQETVGFPCKSVPDGIGGPLHSWLLTCCRSSRLPELMHLQGKIDHHRRNYADLIEGIMQRPRLLEHPGFSLRLVGSAANGGVEVGLAGKIWAVTDRSSFKVGNSATAEAPLATSCSWGKVNRPGSFHVSLLNDPDIIVKGIARICFYWISNASCSLLSRLKL